MFEIFITPCITVIIGVVVFSAGKIIEYFMIEPIHELKREVGNIADVLIFYADIYTSPGLVAMEKQDETSKILRQKSSLLISKYHLIPIRCFLSFFPLILKEKRIKEAHKKLIRLSNNVHQGDCDINEKTANEIRKALKITLT